MPVLTYGSETMIWRDKERSRIRAVQMDSLRGLLGIRRTDKGPNARIRQLCGVTKGEDEKIDEDVLPWFSHVEGLYRECTGNRSVGRPRKRGIDTVKDCLRKKGLEVRQARRMVHNKSVWRGFVRGNACGVPQGMNH